MKDPRNFSNAPVITLIRNTGGSLKVQDHLVGAKHMFLQTWMVQIVFRAEENGQNMCKEGPSVTPPLII